MSFLHRVKYFNVLQLEKLVFHNFKISSPNLAAFKLPSAVVQTAVQPIRLYSEEKPEGSEEEPNNIVDSAKDRSKVIPVEVSIQYLKSSAYQTTYGEDPVWTHYRRNHKGPIPPEKTRKRCIRANKISCGNPCPICRDEYLVLHPKNTELLKQFISPHTGDILSYKITGLCQRRHQELLVAIMQAKDLGLISFDLPFQEYDYSEYVDQQKLKNH